MSSLEDSWGSASARPIALIVTLLLAVTPRLGAQAATRDSIDLRLDACLELPSGQSTLGMVECTGEAIRAWDRRMNAAYQAAMTALDPVSRRLLRTSQRQWLAFREAERAAVHAPWRNDRGSLTRVEVISANLEAIRTRTRELQIYVP